MTQLTPQMQKDIIAGFVRFIMRRHHNNELSDTSVLPWPKETIVSVCLDRLSKEKNPNIRRTIGEALLRVALYQDGVGIEPMQNCRLDLFTMDINSLDATKLAAVQQVVAEHLPHLDSARFLATLRLVQAEFNQLNAACEAIERQHETNMATVQPSVEAITAGAIE